MSGYFAAGQVPRVTVDAVTVNATVDGTRPYRVRHDVTTKGLRGRCSCPSRADGVFCKRCVATSLAWLERRRGGEAGEPHTKPLSDKHLRLLLRGCGQEWLVDQLMMAAKSVRHAGSPARRAGPETPLLGPVPKSRTRGLGTLKQVLWAELRLSGS
ncbi:hypothetical protein GCM10010178_90590 [Lentzea flava]|uniref:SWIM-type domain-containing protein n=1 Tax=Lentzea flava TaxID=103732 RepID=A0ABQ2VJJ5_9PSEU|nr:hypothetical protein GCM10010178_90590 [Lentzea flava]